MSKKQADDWKSKQSKKGSTNDTEARITSTEGINNAPASENVAKENDGEDSMDKDQGGQ